MKGNKRFLALLLSVVLLALSLPLQVFAFEIEVAEDNEQLELNYDLLESKANFSSIINDENVKIENEQDVYAEDAENFMDAKVFNASKPELITDDHIVYISGKKGFFNPKDDLTRAEAAQMIYVLSEDKTDGPPVFSDVQQQWFAKPVNCLAAQGILNGYGKTNTFKPNGKITRAEFVTILSRYYEKTPNDKASFSDVSTKFWAYSAIAMASTRGWIKGYPNGSFKPNSTITRAEAVTIINRTVDREADAEVMEHHEYALYPDVLPGYWAYNDIMEASISHAHKITDNNELWLSHVAPESQRDRGFHLIGTELYHVNGQGLFSRNTVANGFEFGSDCKYTSGNAELDKLMGEIILEETFNKDTPAQKLRKIYLYTRDRMTYLTRPNVEKGTKDWEVDYAYEMLTTKKGNCFSYAATFQQFAKRLGFDLSAVSGLYSGSIHCWVVNEKSNPVLVYDPQMERRYRDRGDYRSFYAQPYDNIPKNYVY